VRQEKDGVTKKRRTRGNVRIQGYKTTANACSGTGAMITRPPVSISRGRVKHAGPFSPGKLRLCNLLEVHRILLSAILPRASRFRVHPSAPILCATRTNPRDSIAQ